ncbi:MAG: SPOR domain-containing protein [Bacteroidetes bacterium]|nr:MAG: SPOR domain-containing protein [Bacteroidota bacterium]REK04814.1 MAG: SPOR domain-containing protein [Bacteroidota bacterium]REK36287.1 MAG: SPOR domain-containing protein [Bacteroidota bacterium]REK51049.1 MAG: SPOR domain-containing protein [Bacteroidota bacterium]
MNKVFLSVILCFILVHTGFAQKNISTSYADSALIYTRDSRLDELIEKQKQLNLLNQSVSGYRIQIYFGGNRQKASEVKLDFAGKYPEVPSYLTYQPPNFKVRVGDFRSTFEARKFLREIEGKFPTNFIVPDDIKLPPIN